MPVIPLTLIGRDGDRFDTVAILDSGGDFTLIPRGIAEILKINVNELPTETALGVGGRVTVWKTKATIELSGPGEHRRFTFNIPVMVRDQNIENFPILLGRAGFFDKFEITFKEKDKSIILKPEQ